MTPQTVKMLMMFFLAAALLNLTNYLFYWFYDPPSRKAVKVPMKEKFPMTRTFVTKSLASRSINWTQSLICEVDTTKAKPSSKGTVSDKSSSEEIQMDYRDQSTETNGYYYYNGIRRGPVMCPEIPPGLGPIKSEDLINLDAIESLYSILQPGGVYEELDCTPRQTVAVIVPYSGQKSQLTEFLYSIHPFLIKQQLEYQIFVVEQGNKSQPLNLGKLLNIGYAEAQRLKKNGGWRCMVFHHHDLVPTDTRNLYRCGEQPRQLLQSLTTNQSYEFPFGGAIVMKPLQFSKINGFSNLYVGNDAVYDDLAKRLINANMTIDQSNATAAKYARLNTDINEGINNKNQSQMIETSSPLNLLDGLSTLTYTLTNIEMRPLHTLIKVDLDKESYSRPGTVNGKLWDRLLNHATSNEHTSMSEFPGID